MTVHIRFLGVAGFEILNSKGKVILIDPYLEENPVSPVRVSDLKRVDLVLVTHLADDHLGDAAAISQHFNCPVVCGPEVAAFLQQQGADKNLMRVLPWGGQVSPKGIRIRAVESHHTSFRMAPSGQYLCGQPLAFIIYDEPEVRIYHSGDSSIFSDLKLIGKLYKPNIGLLCACELEKDFLESKGHFDHYGNEMSGDEGAQAALWLGLEYAIICHYLNPDGHEDIERFFEILEDVGSAEGSLPKPIALKAGETFKYPVSEP